LAAALSKYETLQRKADELLKLGDSLSRTSPAESKRLLRKCRRLRLEAKALKND
jgi:hypothetical protein